MNGITYSLGLNNSGLVAGLAGGLAAVRGFVGGMAGIAASVGALIGVGSAAAAMGLAIHKAADMEGFQTGFEVLLGSMDAAKRRMADLAKFAADTPFELPEVAQASRALETLTKGALATGQGLTLVGDVASGTQQPFADLAVWIGRLYDGLQSGREVGEAMARLQELGVISGDVRDRIESLQKSGKKGDEVWNVMAASLGRFSGMMEKQSRTWNGMMSTLSDNIGAVFRELGTPMLDQLKPILAQGITFADHLSVKAREAGQELATAFSTARELFQSGELGNAFGLSLRIGAGTAVNLLAGSLEGLTKSFGVAFGVACKMGVDELSYMTTPDFWKGLGDALLASVQSAAAVLSKAIGDMIEGLSKITGFKDLAGSAGLFQDASRDNEEKSKANAAAAANHLSDYTSNQMETLTEGLNAAWAGIKDSVGGMKIIDVAGLQSQLSDIIHNAWAASFDKQNLDILKGFGADVKNGPDMSGVATSLSRSPVVTDKLAKMGGFIGTNGGPAGQKAAEDTSRNTKMAVTHLQKLSNFAENWNQRGGHGATF